MPAVFDQSSELVSFSNALRDLFVVPNNKPFTAEQFFGAGILNIWIHDIWRPVQDDAPSVANGKDVNTHKVGSKHLRWDDWKCFEKYFLRDHDAPWSGWERENVKSGSTTLMKSYPTGFKADLTTGCILVPMGDVLNLAAQRSVAECAHELDAGASNVPDGYLGIVLHKEVLDFLLGNPTPALRDINAQFNACDGFLAEQCWQWFLISRLNQQNHLLRCGLRLKLSALSSDSSNNNDSKDADEAALRAELARLSSSLNDSTARVCLCRGIRTASHDMLECANARCATKFFHKRCVAADRQAEDDTSGAKWFCRRCTDDVVYFLYEPALFAAVETALRTAVSPREVLAPLARDLARLMYYWDGRKVVGREMGRVVETVRALDGWVGEKRRAGGEVAREDVARWLWGVKQGGGGGGGGLGEMRVQVVAAEGGGGGGVVDWRARRVGGQAAEEMWPAHPVRAAEAVLRWEMRREMGER